MMLFGDTRSYLSFPTFFSTIRKTTFLLFRVYSTVSLLATSSSPPLKNRFLLVLVSLYHTRASNMRGKHIHTYVYFICLLCSIYSLPPPFPLQTSRKPTSQNPHSQSQSQVHCLSPLRWRCPYRQSIIYYKYPAQLVQAHVTLSLVWGSCGRAPNSQFPPNAAVLLLSRTCRTNVLSWWVLPCPSL